MTSSPPRALTPAAQALARCRAEGRAALVGYLPVGYPSVEGSVEAMLAMVAAGVDVVEVGLPYSDPLMDGPVIQRATEAALQAGTRVEDVFTAVRALADAGAPAYVMTYWNLVLHRGVEKFAADLAAAGGSGLITPDLVPDEAGPWLAASDAHGLDRVFLVAPSSTPERLRVATGASRGFVYAASTMGVTGTRDTRRLGRRGRGRPDPRGHRLTGVRGSRGVHPGPGRRGGAVRRRRDRRVGARGGVGPGHRGRRPPHPGAGRGRA